MEFSPGIAYLLGQIEKLLVRPGSELSLASLAAVLVFALLLLRSRRRRRDRVVRWRVLLRALFPLRMRRSASVGADIGFLFFHVFLHGLLLGWAVLSFQALSDATLGALTAGLGDSLASALPEWSRRAIMTVALFLAYELGYWFNHYLSHRVPVLWEFHRVHHCAEVLTPLTNYRVHPLYIVVFSNILAVATGLTNGVVSYALGEAAPAYALDGTNAILVLFIYTYVHFQHSEMWLPLRGWLGHVFMSPAHHQVHHSTDPRHFDKNMGSCLALWDWMFGTLHIPTREREVTGFGVAREHDPHTISGALLVPVMRAGSQLARLAGRLSPRRLPDVQAGKAKAKSAA